MLGSAISNDDFVQQLLDAVKRKDKAAIKNLCSSKSISTLNSRQKNAAMYIGKSGDEKGCEFFIEQGAQALDCAKGAAFGGYEKLARTLINNKAVHYPELCYFAAWGGNAEATARLLNATRTLKIDHVAICDTIADYAEKGGHKEMAQKYRTMARVRAAKAEAKKDEKRVRSSDEESASSEKSSSQKNQSPVHSASERTAPEKSSSRSAAEQLVVLTGAIPAATQAATKTAQNPGAAHVAMTLTPATQKPAAAQSVTPATQKPAAAQSVTPATQKPAAAQSTIMQTTPVRSATPMQLGHPAQLGAQTVPTSRGAQKASAPVTPLSLPAKTTESGTPVVASKRPVTPPPALEEKRAAPIAHLFRKEQQGSKSPVIDLASDDVVASESAQPRTLEEALVVIQKLKGKVSELERKNAMLNIGLKNKQSEVGDLRALILKDPSSPVGTPTAHSKPNF
ncbi:MAG: hypothetical protein JSR17_03590 [Proteobacteria bacterium]|nr:hypothetical protein [Pseudomonadota bacterium]